MDSSPAAGRRSWPDETKARIVEEALTPDVNVSATARRYGMSPSQLFGWRRKAIAKG
ncbi:transposase [uncultured Devosia sp.]|uniref:transposase n=1 Tax=uncultured Devosia sp. TaxID=211434 RepID=UPI00262D5656|nr:transposase [uncultured Devosia sp.]